MKKLAVLGFFLSLSGFGLRAQVVPINDDFEARDPCDPTLNSGWECHENLRWVAPDTDPCDPATADLRSCTNGGIAGEDDHSVPSEADPQCNLFTPGEGYVLVTADCNDQHGSMFRKDPVQYNNFKLTAEVELRGGHAKSRPADGMCIVIQGDAGNGPPVASGSGGGGMGAPGLRDAAGPMLQPTMVFEFDNWNCNCTDNPGFKTLLRAPDDNHVAFHYSAFGFQDNDDFVRFVDDQGTVESDPKCNGVNCNSADQGCNSNDALAHIGPKLNGVETGTQSGRWLFEVFVQEGTVACNVTNLAVGFPKTRMYTYTIPNFQPFEGYLGVTASTGGANQNHILHSIKIETLPANFCLKPPFDADRKIVSPHTDTREVSPLNPAGTVVPVWRAGDVLDVSITLRNVRANEPPRCLTPTDCLVNETVPAGWTPTNISDSGSFAAATGKIQWHVQNAAIAAGKVLSYKIAAVDNTFAACFSANLIENVALSEPNAIAGDSCVEKDSPFDSCGGIRTWNILGAFDNPGGAGPTEDVIRLDYMTDGTDTETSFVWFPGRAIATEFGGDGAGSGAISTSVTGGANGWDPGGIPTVFAWNDDDASGWVDYLPIFTPSTDLVMVYAQCYVINNGADKEVNAGISSDDSVQVILNGDEVWIHSIPRGGASACGPQDITPDGGAFTNKLLLKHGENNLIVKTFEGGGGWNHSFRFQDDTGAAFTQDLDVKLEPSGVCIKPAMKAVRSIDTGETALVQGQSFPKYSDGKTYDVSIAISNPRATNGPCSPPGTITLVEAVPAGWVPSSASNSGSINNNVITWSLNGASLPSSLTYKVKAIGNAPEVSIGGLFSDAGALGKYAVSGAGLLFNPTDFTDQGFIKTWLLLGPYSQPAGLGANPGAANIRKDHLTDEGANKELTIQPKAGDKVQTHYGPPTCAPEGTPGCKAPPKARSVGLTAPATANGINPGGIPTWAEWRDRDDTINFNDYYGGDLSHVMMYAVTYVKVDRDIPIAIGLGSDDSIQVLLDGQEIWLCNLPRGSDGNNAIQDVIAADPALRSSTAGGVPACDVGTNIISQLDPLTAGCHELMVKVFEEGGGHEFRLRFQDPGSGDPITDGLSIFLKPDCTSGQPVGPLFHRGDADGNGTLQLTDAVRILNFLFLGTGKIDCKDAADADNNGTVQLTDAVRILNVLFLGTGTIPDPGAPGPSFGNRPCGPDPADGAHIGCDSYNCGA